MFDTHAHLITSDTVAYPPSPLKGALRDGVLDDPMTAERLLRLMDSLKVERAIAVQRAHVYGYDNRYVIESARKYPDRFRAVCVIDPLAHDACAAVSRWVSQGAAGIRLTEPHKGADTQWLASDRVAPVWDLIAKSEITLCLQFYRWNRSACLEVLPDMLRKFPDIKVVIDHVTSLVEEEGEPDFGVDAALVALAQFPNVFYKFTTINLARMAQAGIEPGAPLRRLVKTFGPAQLMWGSDVAQSAGPYSAMVEMARAAVADFSAETQQRFLKSSADAFYGRFFGVVPTAAGM